MRTTQGAKLPPTLDGLHLSGVPPESWEISVIEYKGNLVMADGSVREQRRAADAGFPLITTKRTFSLAWTHLGRLQESVEARLAFPGPHRLCAWKYETLGYRGDGQRVDLFLPGGWRIATHHLTPPEGLTVEGFAPVVRIGFETAALAVLSVAPEELTNAAPGPGEAWFEVGTNRMVLGTPPAPEEYVIVQVVPEITCFTSGEADSRRYSDPHREPRRIVLVEA